MENNRLNINRPLLSVRRRTSSQNNNNNTKTESRVPVRPSVESCTAEIMNTGSVPFGWEHSPGRPKNEQVQTIESVPSLPKLPPGRFLSLKPMSNDAVTNASKITKSDSLESTKKENLDVKYDVGTDNDHGDDEDDDDEAYMDALDTLSRGETSFYNCSASGVSGFGSDVKPYRSVPDDPKMRDFMMGRFLPAAKAMAADLPQQHTFKKNVIKEKPQEVKKLVNIDDNNKKMLRYGPNFLQDVTPDKKVEDDENDDDDADDDDDDSVYDYSSHGNKSSKLCGLLPRFCSVNPVHGMCVRARLPVSSAKGAQTSSSSSNSSSEPARSGIYKHRSLDSILKNEPNQTSNLEGLKLYNRLQGNAISANLSGSFQSTVSEQIDSNSKKKGTSFKDLLADKNTNATETTDSQDTLVEKTLYVDTVQIIKSPQENKQSVYNEPLKPDMLADEPNDEPKNDQETKKFEDHEVGLEVVDDFINDGDKQLKASKTEVVDDIIYEGDKQLKASESKVFELPVPPPLPKSPSDSWLCRTLPSVPLKNAHMRWNNKYPSSNMLTNDPKADDNIRLRNPQGQLYSIPES